MRRIVKQSMLLKIKLVLSKLCRSKLDENAFLA